MDGAGFDPTRWSHWLLIICFSGVSAVGLALSWQWRREARVKRKRAKLAHRLMQELHGVSSLSPKEIRFSVGEASRLSGETLPMPENFPSYEEFSNDRSASS